MGTLSDTNPSGLQLEDLFGAATPPKWAAPLLRYINSQQRILQQAIQGRLTIENMGWDYKSARFSHGVPQSLLTKKVVAPKGILITSADGETVVGFKVSPSSVAGQVNVTVLFDNPAAVNVLVAMYIVPDGVASGR